MSAWNNRITVIGNVGQDPQMFDAGGNTVAKFNVAAKRSSKSEKTDWIPVSAWHDLARGIEANIKKGDSVIIFGSLQVDSKKNDDGTYLKFYSLNADSVGKQVYGIKKDDDGEILEDDPPF